MQRGKQKKGSKWSDERTVEEKFGKTDRSLFHGAFGSDAKWMAKQTTVCNEKHKVKIIWSADAGYFGAIGFKMAPTNGLVGSGNGILDTACIME